MVRLLGAIAAAALVLAAVASVPADAAFPGANGKIAYSVESESPAAVWIANPDGSSATRLAEGRNPSFSPTGTRIAFERWHPDASDVLVMNADGSGQVELLNGDFLQDPTQTTWEADYEASSPPQTIPFVKVQATTSTIHTFEAPSFSPDGSQLAVSETIEEHKFTVVCAVAEAEGTQCIPEGEPGAYFDSWVACITCNAHILTISSTSGARAGDATPPTEGIYDREPAFSADGKLAFRRESGIESSIFAVDSPGAAPRQLTFGGSDWSPDFSPDGSEVVFSQESKLGIVASGGGPAMTVPVPDPPGGEGFASYPVFSPDGTRVAFNRGVFPQGTPGEGLYTVGVDGSGLSPVSSLGGSTSSWAPLVTSPPPPSPAKAARAKARKGRIRLDRRGRGRIGTITCGSSACTLASPSARLTTSKGKCAVRATSVKKLAAGKSAPLRVRVAGKCLKSLQSTGRGKLSARVRVADILGEKTLTITAALAPARDKRHG